jgi:hypothetical protein
MKNFLVYAGAKNYLGHDKKSTENVYVYVDLNGAHACYVDDSPGANDVYSNNKVRFCAHVQITNS